MYVARRWPDMYYLGRLFEWDDARLRAWYKSKEHEEIVSNIKESVEAMGVEIPLDTTQDD